MQLWRETLENERLSLAKSVVPRSLGLLFVFALLCQIGGCAAGSTRDTNGDKADERLASGELTTLTLPVPPDISDAPYGYTDRRNVILTWQEQTEAGPRVGRDALVEVGIAHGPSERHRLFGELPVYPYQIELDQNVVTALSDFRGKTDQDARSENPSALTDAVESVGLYNMQVTLTVLGDSPVVLELPFTGGSCDDDGPCYALAKVTLDGETFKDNTRDMLVFLSYDPDSRLWDVRVRHWLMLREYERSDVFAETVANFEQSYPERDITGAYLVARETLSAE